MTKFIAAAVQMDSQDDKMANLAAAEGYIREAAARGARLVVLPESMNYIGRDMAQEAEAIPGGPTFQRLSGLARELDLWLEAGSIYESNQEDPARPFNTTFLIRPDGTLAAKYAKLHPFDVVLPNGVTSRESDRVCPGKKLTVAETDLGKVGLGICYDIRFGEMFRIMALEGAKLFAVPANFTVNTGKDHWEVLLRARAIENECYVIAPNQMGKKPRFTAYGNSLMVDPWGTVIARASDKPGVITAEIDLDYVTKVRQSTFTLDNRRPDVYQLRKL
ncbi:carbon-nitrogen hydrolase family protein [Acidaminococcus fermentans]|uniref:carbon-nitrogen hydrolase family protein n=1 Tax=Acidaminococcus fermentans TaxID=905 RepID=UPI00242C0092|nr:carbon-nitrogen hydrolase family protein [Acidaminococcus fermentans]MDY2852672.1 carbon-nitrogen hydrolase family protein [Acidaminococcus fermentans]